MSIATRIRNLFRRKSALRCWPGCVAQVVGGSLVGEFLGGKTMTLTRLTKNGRGDPSWQYEGAQFLIVLSPMHIVVVDHIPDADLRPLTPPPGSAKESELREIPAPNREGVTA